VPYVERDQGNKIKGIFNRPQQGIPVEFLDENDPGVMIFKNPPPTALEVKKAADIALLGTRADMQAEAAAANSVPALRDLVLKLAEIIYSNEKGTID
jgi:hypothetical protein